MPEVFYRGINKDDDHKRTGMFRLKGAVTFLPEKIT